METVTLDALRAFVVFAEHANLTKAAVELHISQPALHAKIQKLSASIGAPLYEKHGRELHLTATGISLSGYAKNMDSDLENFLATLTADSIEPITLAAGEGAHRYVVAQAVRLLIERGSRLRLLTTDRNATIEAVRSTRADIGVTVLTAKPRGLAVTELATYPQVALMPAGHPLGRSRSLRLADLADSDLILAPPGRPLRETVDRAIHKTGGSLNVVAEAEGWAQMLHFTAIGAGICIVNGCVTPDDNLVARPIEDLPPVTYSAVYRPADKTKPGVVHLLDALQATMP